jgi:hypothetical protein
MKQHKWHKEIKAWADGGDVQFNAGGDFGMTGVIILNLIGM